MAKNVTKHSRVRWMLLLAACWCFLQAGAQLTGKQTLSFTIENGWQLDKVLMELSRQSGVNIAFNPMELKQVAVKPQSFTATSLETILNKILGATPFTWQLQNSRLVVFRRLAKPVTSATDQLLHNQQVPAVKASYAVSGVVRNEEGKPLMAATIWLPQWNQYYITDAAGRFYITVKAAESLVLEAVYVGYKPVAIELSGVTNDTLLPDIQLKEVSLRLKDIAVTAGRNFEGSSNSSFIISREVIEQTPALSLNDLLGQLPNKMVPSPSLQNVQNLNLRSVFQAGDKNPFQLNNAFGIAIVMDGNVISNNLNMQSYNPGMSGVGSSFVKSGNGYGLSGSGTTSYTGDYTYGGIDLRQIAPDNIESIEVVAGVASAKYGDLSDGAVIIERQAGVSKGNVRMQLRDNATSYSFSKGFRLSEKAGVLSTSLGYVSSYADARDKLKAYRRMNSNVSYTNYLGKAKRLKMTAIADYSRNLDGIRQDPDDLTATRVKFDSWNGSLAGRFNYRVNGGFIKDVSVNLRYSHSHQYSYREEFINNSFVLYTHATETGMHEGIYDKGIYTAVSIIDGRPVNITGTVDVAAAFRTGRVTHALSMGASYNWGKNMGKGQVVEPGMPRTLAANSTTSLSAGRAERYYDFSRVIAQKDMGLYAEDIFKVRVHNRYLNVRSGIRLDVQNGFLSASPRINTSYELSRRLRVGLAYGIFFKSPALAQRYPGPVFNEIMVANFYNGKVEESQSLIYLYRFNPVNNQLRSSRNQTLEFSSQYRHKGFSVGMNAYAKWADNGITTVTQRQIQEVPVYSAQYQPGAKPVLTQTGTRKHNLQYYAFANTLTSNSQGVELMGTSPQVKAMATSFSLSAGFTRTHYFDRAPSYSSVTQDGPTLTIPTFGYMGLYPPREYTTYFSSGRFTSVTHVPRISLILQFTAECMIMQKTVRAASQGIPYAYYNNAQEYIPITKFNPADPMYGHLYKPESELNDQNVPRMVMNYHLTVGKEIRKKFRVSFNVYNVFNYQPYYITSSGTYQYPNTAPTFGAELSVKL
ncbi:outer membrane receptor protein involved in Fe transport [Filimonas zeae]|nr:carboxypeptidase-like regulatory domain-containing protein [Filimonas zeae]MDR6338935.1 outer membrane receptor protein involved in Fe transport [Filimonas zeae]